MSNLNLGERWVFAMASASALVLGAFATAAAQPANYTTLDVKGRVQLEIPSDWTIDDMEHRKRVKEFGEKLSGTQSSYMASLSVQSYPTPSRMFVRVSFIKLEPPISQPELRREVRADQRQVIRELADMWKVESPAMWAALAKSSVKEVGHAGFAVEQFGGQTALVIRYGRTSIANPSETMKVAQYHVPLGAEKALITLSYIDGDQGAFAAHDRLKRSIVIR